MKLKKRHIFLGIIFFSYFLLRVYFSIQTDYFSDESSYFALRQIENIAKTGKPIITDNLSYGGRTFAFLPLYYYFLALFTFFGKGVFWIKIANNFLASTVIIAVYLVCSKVIKNRKISLLCAFISGMVPIYISETLNNISSYSVIIPGTFFAYYLFSLIGKDKSKLEYLVFLTIILVMSSPSSFLTILGIIIFIGISYIEGLDSDRISLEYMSFFLFFLIWVNFLIYKTAFQMHGFSIIWGNAPSEVLDLYFKNIDLPNAAASIGVLPLIFGIYTIYSYLMKKKDMDVLLYMGLFLAAFILFWLKLIPANLGLVFMGTSLVILMGQSFSDLFSYLKKTKFSGNSTMIFNAFLALLILTQAIPGMYAMLENSKIAYSEEYIEGFSWLKEYSDSGSVILSAPEDGNLIPYFSNRKNVMDMSFMLIPDSQTISDDIGKVFTQRFRIEAIRVIEKYGVDYVLVTPKAKSRYGIAQFPYAQDRCFTLAFNNNEIEIYKVNKEMCELKSL